MPDAEALTGLALEARAPDPESGRRSSGAQQLSRRRSDGVDPAAAGKLRKQVEDARLMREFQLRGFVKAFAVASEAPDVVRNFRRIAACCGLDGAEGAGLNGPAFYRALKDGVFSRCGAEDAKRPWRVLDKKLATHPRYFSRPDIEVLVVGAGPVGLRTAVELGLIGARVTVVEQYGAEDVRRPNVLKLWDWASHDLGMLGIKHTPSCIMQGPGNKHIGTNSLQVALLRTALLLGARVHFQSAFVRLVPPPALPPCLPPLPPPAPPMPTLLPLPPEAEAEAKGGGGSAAAAGAGTAAAAARVSAAQCGEQCGDGDPPCPPQWSCEVGVALPRVSVRAAAPTEVTLQLPLGALLPFVPSGQRPVPRRPARPSPTGPSGGSAEVAGEAAGEVAGEAGAEGAAAAGAAGAEEAAREEAEREEAERGAQAALRAALQVRGTPTPACTVTH
jgi:hypothetical protein